MPCLFKHITYIVDILKHGGVFAHAGDSFCDIKFLVTDSSERESFGELLGISCRCGVFNLTADDKHRNRIEPSADNAGNCVCAAGTCSNAESGNFVIESGIGFSRNCTCLLMVIIGAMNSVVMTECVIEVHCTAADNSKAVGYAAVGKKICNIVSKSDFHFLHPLSVLI